MKTKFFIILICLVAFASSAFAQAEEMQKIDGYEDVQCEEYLAHMDLAFNVANNNPASKVYFFVYEGKTKKYKYKKDGSYELISVLPQYGLAKTKIRSMKKLIALRKISADRFVFIESGLRENFTVEVWHVPVGATAPKPTPTLTKIRYRKGRPIGFCLGCCEG